MFPFSVAGKWEKWREISGRINLMLSHLRLLATAAVDSCKLIFIFCKWHNKHVEQNENDNYKMIVSVSPKSAWYIQYVQDSKTCAVIFINFFVLQISQVKLTLMCFVLYSVHYNWKLLSPIIINTSFRSSISLTAAAWKWQYLMDL